MLAHWSKSGPFTLSRSVPRSQLLFAFHPRNLLAVFIRYAWCKYGVRVGEWDHRGVLLCRIQGTLRSDVIYMKGEINYFI